MHIKQLSDITGVHIETIRSYRKAGYLHPSKLPNGYYDYSQQDLVSLFWIRKLRGYTMPMDQIHAFFFSDDPNNLLSILEEKKEFIRREITSMELAMRFIDLETRHITETVSSGINRAAMFQSIDDKIDIYSLKHRSARFRELYYCMTPTVHISKEILNGSLEDRMIPIRVGMGTYRYILDEHSFPVPNDAVIIPNGLNIQQQLILHNFNEISLSDLSPMITYARANNLVFFIILFFPF
jgi:DNA-binding transcriptional MerR regulator